MPVTSVHEIQLDLSLNRPLNLVPSYLSSSSLYPLSLNLFCVNIQILICHISLYIYYIYHCSCHDLYV